MTAIAYRDGIMAADTCAWTGPDACLVIPAVPKIVRLQDGGLIACCGGADDIGQFCGWMLGDGIPEGAKFDKDEGFEAIWVKPDGEIVKFWATLRPQRTVAPFVALGRAGIFMHGAMAAGASAARAVELAIEHTDGARGTVQREMLYNGGDVDSIIEVQSGETVESALHRIKTQCVDALWPWQ